MGNWASGMMLPDIPRAYTALAEWASCMLCVCLVDRRYSVPATAGLSAAFLVWQTVYLVLSDGLTGMAWIVCMLVAVGFMFVFLQVCCRGTALDNGYRCVESFVLAELAASLGWQLYCYLYYELGVTGRTVGWAVLLLAYAVVFGIMYLWVGRPLGREGDMEVRGRELVSFIVIGGAIFFVSNLSFAFINTPFTANYSSAIFNIRTLIDLGGVAILYACHTQRMNMRTQYELEMTEGMLRLQYRQYQHSRETVDMINYRYHDLKNHIIALRAGGDDGDRGRYLDEMEASIVSYEAQNRTGNGVLDIILTDKSLACQNLGILLTLVVDGKLLDFMEDIDLCSIFGNALDNAIEAEKKIEEGKRVIRLSVFSQRKFLIIRCENTFEEKLSLREGLPRTTKKGEGLHGFGLKSIRSAARKYGGDITTDREDGCFVLKILIPLPEARTETGEAN